jgi:Na+/H+-translocating membrane pyrophosphatase
MQLEIILACGVLALLYGLWTIRSVLSLPAGTARMQEIAAAIQEAHAPISTANTRPSPSSAW